MPFGLDRLGSAYLMAKETKFPPFLNGLVDTIN